MVTKFDPKKYYLTSSKPSLIVREVAEFWIAEDEVMRACDERRIVFIERYLGDRTEAWLSVVDNEVEVMRWNANKTISIEFKAEPVSDEQAN